MNADTRRWLGIRHGMAAAFLILTLHAALAAPARAQARMEFIPSVSLFTVYDDNIFARVDGSAGQMLQLRPSFEGSYESERLRLLGLYSFDMQRSNFSSLNTLDARRHALGETRFRTSPMTTLSLVTRYDRSETPGEINIETGLLGERRTAERVQVAPGVQHRLGQRAMFTGGYDWTTEHLVEGERGTLHVGRFGLSREVTERVSLTATYVGRYFVDDFDDHTSNGILFGWERETAPGTRLSFAAGPKMTSYRGLTPEVSAAFTRTTTRIRLALDYWHGETIVLGIRGPVAVDSGTARFSWPLTSTIEIGTHAGVSDVVTLDSRATTIYRGTLVGSWTPGGIYTVATSYGLDYQIGDIRNRLGLDGETLLLDDRVLRHVFRVSVTVAPRWRRSILPPDEAARAKGVTR